MNFYSKSVLRGYLKSWLALAEKRYQLEDYEGAYLLFAYTSFLGLSQGSFSAGYAWEKGKTGEFKCRIGESKKCALYFYLQSVDYFKSAPRVADLISLKLSTLGNPYMGMS